MQETEAIIERVWQLSSHLQRLELTVDPALHYLAPGQSLLALPAKQWEPYLREHWIPVDIQEGQVIVERQADQLYTPGQVVSLIGAVGNELPWVGGGNKHLLLIVQDAPPTPLLMLAQAAVRQMAEVALVLLGTATEYPFAGIPAAVEVINGGENFTWQDRDNMLLWADQIFAVAHEAFWTDHFTSLFHLVKKVRHGYIPVNFLYGVFNNLPLPCGTGACSACMVRCKTSNKTVCTQGPALDLTEVYLS